MKYKFLATLLLALGITNAVQAGDNGAYIDQIGNQSTINVTQTGTSNLLQGLGASLGNPLAKMYGDSNTIAITQVGSGNNLSFGLDSSATGSTNTVVYKLNGSNNTSIINCNDSGSGKCDRNTINVDKTGDNNGTQLSMVGSNNSVSYVTTGGNNNIYNGTFNGDNIISVTNIQGGGNNVAISSTPLAGTAAEADVTIVGAGNTVGIIQTGGSIAGNYASISISGSSNQISATQSGITADNVLRVTSQGNNNVMRFNQSSR